MCLNLCTGPESRTRRSSPSNLTKSWIGSLISWYCLATKLSSRSLRNHPVSVGRYQAVHFDFRRRSKPSSDISHTPRGEPFTRRPRWTIRRRTNWHLFSHRTPPEGRSSLSSSVRLSSSRCPTIDMTSRAGADPPNSSRTARIGITYSSSGNSNPSGVRDRIGPRMSNSSKRLNTLLGVSTNGSACFFRKP